jgi:hypothetical protein
MFKQEVYAKYLIKASTVKVYHGSHHIYDKFDISKVRENGQEWGKGMYFSENLKGADSADSYGEYIYSTEIDLQTLCDVTSFPDAVKVAKAIGLTGFEEKYDKKKKELWDWYGALTSYYLDEKGYMDVLKLKDIISREYQKMGYSGLYISFRNWVVLFNPEKHEIKRDLDAEKKIGATLGNVHNFPTISSRQILTIHHK